MVYPAATTDGIAGDQVMLSPPLIVTRSDVEEIIERFGRALEDVERGLLAEGLSASVA